MKNDRTGLEENQIIVFIGWDLPEGLDREMRLAFHRLE